ncbi:copper resistance protein NlpE N-terminal domain-containing protein [Pontibacter sp. BT310]|uniref:Copper resistance protein NlpE N-terminal domain-containing protein n=1 Tax=Pontibacter populi TaxID=890055 RepID=A0ABS6XBQ1_9BACT|nr:MULTISPECIES: copper resistance protein NlpE N-terminal domain-containing protein [Pontibacter]MBJ6118562.1 copper resistance protein NlpE N-terminal domain-containing protein [Pontibacter sp. BT310]MBR0570991.1 copper resistance protein NlpE N-terminal domain-containing protein [Microvirga sp. STS03]MBW3365416.1 copper resistance protein NlpE N-terminal domain-containing protein [Pontibacter populi]
MMNRFWVFLVLVTIVSGCTTSELSTEPVDVAVGESRLPCSVIGVWRGVIPCADCPGINYNLSLNEDNTFEEMMTYQERDVEPFSRTGTWNITDGTLTLVAQDTTRTQFDLSIGGELHMLDQSGKRITTNLADKYRLRKDDNLSQASPELWNEKRRLGVDFVATGNEPGWALEIDQEKGMYFKTLPSETIAIETAIPEIVNKGKTITYKATAETGDLIVELTAQPCEDTMSGKMSTHTVRVKAKGIEFNGCGMFLNTKSEEK